MIKPGEATPFRVDLISILKRRPEYKLKLPDFKTFVYNNILNHKFKAHNLHNIIVEARMILVVIQILAGFTKIILLIFISVTWHK